MESGFEFDLKLDEDQEDAIPKIVPFDKNSSSFGLEKLKKSGLEDQFAESRLSDKMGTGLYTFNHYSIAMLVSLQPNRTNYETFD